MSCWMRSTDDLGQIARHDGSPAPMNVDAAVIGAGIAGAAIASEIALDHSVVLLEAESQPGYHSTGRSVAILDRAYGNSKVQALTVASLDSIRRLQLEVGGPPLLLRRGVLHVATALQQRAVAQFHERVTTFGHRVEYHDGEFARFKVPLLRAGYITACAYDSEAAEIDVAALLAGLLRRFRARGGTLILRAPVESLLHERGRWDVRSSGGAINARILINAAGAWADAIATLAGGSALGLAPMRRTICTVQLPSAPTQAVWPFVVDIEEAFYFKQEPGRLLVSPADETPVAAPMRGPMTLTSRSRSSGWRPCAISASPKSVAAGPGCARSFRTAPPRSDPIRVYRLSFGAQVWVVSASKPPWVRLLVLLP